MATIQLDRDGQAVPEGMVLTVGDLNERAHEIVNMESYRRSLELVSSRWRDANVREEIDAMARERLAQKLCSPNPEVLISNAPDAIAAYAHKILFYRAVDYIRREAKHRGHLPETCLQDVAAADSEEGAAERWENELEKQVRLYSMASSEEEAQLHEDAALQLVRDICGDEQLVTEFRLRCFRRMGVEEVAAALQIHRSTLWRHQERLGEVLRAAFKSEA
ncbi:MAG: hypothetical protein Fues2KO_04710 [Fuerstiella sp.]